METVVYILDKNTFEIIDVVEAVDYEMTQDEETNAKSTITILKTTPATSKDYVYLKENEKLIFFGIIDEVTQPEGNSIEYNLIVKYITNIFDRKIIVKNQDMISATGIEDFIVYTIENEFTQSADTLLNKTFIDAEALTHTPKNITINNEDGIYNFHTFMTNCTQKYNIVYDFDIIQGRLKMKIKNIENSTKELIDCNVSDILNYEEVYNSNVTAKVTVLCSNGTEYNFYLLNNRTVTEDIDDENRAVGDVETIYQECVVDLIDGEEVINMEETKENARQRALDIFRSNSYKHLIEFDININSTLYDAKKWQCGTNVTIKNTDGDVIDSYVSAITKEKDNPTWRIKTGNIRITLLDKLKQQKL